ncbi:MAG: MerR family transcriptional regulator, partial [Aeromicrobium sp.]
VPTLVLGQDGRPTAATFTEGRSQIRLSRAELIDSAGITSALLDSIEQYGLISRRKSQAYYDGHDLTVASVIAELAGLGLEPRHLKIFRTAADREIGLFEQIVSPVAKQHDKARTAELTGAIAALSIRLHTVLVKDGLSG